MNVKEFLKGLVPALKTANEAAERGGDKKLSADYRKGRASAFEAILKCPAVQAAVKEIKEAKEAKEAKQGG